MTTQKLLVVGGNGFVGSAVCRVAIGRGWDVTSISRSGTPYASAKGHVPAWSNQVKWKAGSAFDPSTYKKELASATAVIHTLGILLESDYKSNGLSGFLGSLARNFSPSGGNPLSPANAGSSGAGKYEMMNRDSALSVFKAHQAAARSPSSFFYLSAEDLFRPIIPARYITTKREAEAEILRLSLEPSSDSSTSLVEQKIKPYFIRPSLIYHPHIRPISTLPATLFDISSSIQSKLPSILRAKTQARLLNRGSSQLPPAFESLANLVSIPPVHVDTVAEAICRLIERPDAVVQPVVSVKVMRELVGFPARDIEEVVW